MSTIEAQPVVGLFGTCGDSTFRKDLFIPEYERLGIAYFNPQVDDWKPEYADVEADHLATDTVQCWPVLGMTYGSGSLAEQGYSIASSLRAPTPLPKFVIPMIEMELSDELTDEIARQESLRARQLAITHMRNTTSPNVFMVDTLQEMLEVSIVLYGVSKNIVNLMREHNPALKRFMESREQAAAIADIMASGELGGEASKLVGT